jgi:hypothetical protein
LAIIAIIAIWVIVGIAIAIMLLFVTIKKPKLVKTRPKIPIRLITHATQRIQVGLLAKEFAHHAAPGKLLYNVCLVLTNGTVCACPAWK